MEKIDYLKKLEERFNENMHRHNKMSWIDVKNKIENDRILEILYKMEETNGEPDVLEYNGEILYVDFSKESPLKRRSLCYDDEALNSRKANKPISSVTKIANEIGIEILSEDLYYYIQNLEELDLRTSSWIKTPNDVRQLGGSLFCDRRYNKIFTYHNGAESYYSSRGFRGYLKIT